MKKIKVLYFRHNLTHGMPKDYYSVLFLDESTSEIIAWADSDRGSGVQSFIYEEYENESQANAEAIELSKIYKENPQPVLVTQVTQEDAPGDLIDYVNGFIKCHNWEKS